VPDQFVLDCVLTVPTLEYAPAMLLRLAARARSRATGRKQAIAFRGKQRFAAAAVKRRQTNYARGRAQRWPLLTTCWHRVSGTVVKTPTRQNIAGACWLKKKTGAGEGIRTLDPNLGKVGITCFWRYPCSCRSRISATFQNPVFYPFFSFTRIFERS